jgi:GNAT superfamily N-acetyltransferase
MTISSVATADLPNVRTLIATTIRQSVAHCEADAEFLISDVDQILERWREDSADSLHLKYGLSDEIVGVALVRNYWNLSTLFVSPTRQRVGIGSLLLAEMLSACREKSPRQKLQVNSSAIAVPFYESQGFRQTGPGIDRPGGCVPMEYCF